MTLGDRVLYHQIHPAKLAIDVTTAVGAAALLWQHRLAAALTVGFVPSIVATAILVQWGDLDPYRDSALRRPAHVREP
jgi:hypothetical protein